MATDEANRAAKNDGLADNLSDVLADTSTDRLVDDSDGDLTDDELVGLFSAFDDVSASDELKNATLARILSAVDNTPSMVDNAPGIAADSPNGEGDISNDAETSEIAVADAPSGFKASKASGSASATPSKATRRAKWRAIRVAALAACLALALTGGVAYATPASYYDIVQDDSTITLGVNCFGITVSVEAQDETARDIVNSLDLRNLPYEQSIERAVGEMESRNPEAPVEYGPQGGERQVTQPQGAQGGSDARGDTYGQNSGNPGYSDPSGSWRDQSPRGTDPQGTTNPDANGGNAGNDPSGSANGSSGGSSDRNDENRQAASPQPQANPQESPQENPGDNPNSGSNGNGSQASFAQHGNDQAAANPDNSRSQENPDSRRM